MAAFSSRAVLHWDGTSSPIVLFFAVFTGRGYGPGSCAPKRQSVRNAESSVARPWLGVRDGIRNFLIMAA